MKWLKRMFWRRRLTKAQGLMWRAKQEYEALIWAGSMDEAVRAYHVYVEHRRASIHYAMKLARK